MTGRPRKRDVGRRVRTGRSVVLAALLVATAGACALVSKDDGGSVPTAVVRREAFTRWVPADGELRAAESTPLQVPTTSRAPLRIAWLAPEGARLEADEVAIRFDPSEVETTVQDKMGELESNRLKVEQRKSKEQADLEKLDRDAEVARRELAHSKEFASRDETIYSRVEIIQSRIDEELAGERLAHAEQDRKRAEDLAKTELEILAIDRRKIAGELETAQATLASMELRSPKAGYLVYRRRRGNPPEVGQVVFPGQTLAEIPHAGAMEVDAYVLEADAGGLEPGRKARVYPESRPDRSYEAMVTRVDSVAKPRFRASPVQYFTVSLSLEATDPEVLKPGLGVRVEILLDDLDDALTVPRQAVFDRGEHQVVRRRDGDGFEDVPVTVRTAGRGRVVIEGGLEAGDRVALADAAAGTTGSGERTEPNDSTDDGSEAADVASKAAGSGPAGGAGSTDAGAASSGSGGGDGR